MNKDQYQKKLAIYILMATSTTLIASNGYAKTESAKTESVTSIDRVTATTKHKLISNKAPTIEDEAAQIENETQKAIIALSSNDPKKASAILKGVSGKLESLLAKNSGLALVPAEIDSDVIDFEGSNKSIATAINRADEMLKHGKLQAARQIVSDLASEIRVTTTSIPFGSYPEAIKKIIPLIETGKFDDALMALNSVLDTLVVTTDVIPLPVLRAEELLSFASQLEHKADLSKENIKSEILKFTDATKEQLELSQLLGYGNKDDYKILYQGIDGINNALFTEKSNATWQKLKDDLSQFKDRLHALRDAAERVGTPAK